MSLKSKTEKYLLEIVPENYFGSATRWTVRSSLPYYPSDLFCDDNLMKAVNDCVKMLKKHEKKLTKAQQKSVNIDRNVI